MMTAHLRELRNFGGRRALRWAARCTALTALGVLAASCASGGAGPAAPSLGLAGEWTQGATLRDTTNAQTHIHTGYFSFARRGETLAGSGVQTGLCHAASGDYEGPLADGLSFDISDGVQSGSHVSFESDICHYEGELSADGSRMDGTMSCSYTDRGVHFDWTGQWLAHRRS